MRRSTPDLDGNFPKTLTRDYERRLLDLCASRTLDATQWAKLGPAVFMAGIAVMLASTRDFDRPSLLTLAEELHAGASTPAEFARWLKASPLRPSRFLPMLRVQMSRASSRS